jgi:hypothetical protein
MIRAEQHEVHKFIVAAPGKIDDVMGLGGGHAINHRTVKGTQLTAAGIALVKILDQLPVSRG